MYHIIISMPLFWSSRSQYSPGWCIRLDSKHSHYIVYDVSMFLQGNVIGLWWMVVVVYCVFISWDNDTKRIQDSHREQGSGAGGVRKVLMVVVVVVESIESTRSCHVILFPALALPLYSHHKHPPLISVIPVRTHSVSRSSLIRTTEWRGKF